MHFEGEEFLYNPFKTLEEGGGEIAPPGPCPPSYDSDTPTTTAALESSVGLAFKVAKNSCLNTRQAIAEIRY